MIIGVNGYSGTGKDTVGKIIQYLTCSIKFPSELSIEERLLGVPDCSGHLVSWEIKKFAGKLKQIASILTGIPQDKFEDQEFKKTLLGKEWVIEKPYHSTAKWIFDNETYTDPMSVREFLQKLGTDGLRRGLHTNTWVNALFADYKKIEFGDEEQGEYPNWVITDVRFPNEAKAIKEKGGVIIRVDRPGVKAINTHPSEVGLDEWNFDYKIWNGSDITALTFTIQGILKEHGIIK